MSHNARIIVALLVLPLTVAVDVCLLCIGGRAQIRSHFMLSKSLLEWGGPRRPNPESCCIECGAPRTLPNERCETCSARSA